MQYAVEAPRVRGSFRPERPGTAGGIAIDERVNATKEATGRGGLGAVEKLAAR